MYNKPQGLFPILQEELKPHGEIGHTIIRVLASSTVDHRFEPRSGPTRDYYKIGICCFYTKHAALRSKSTDCFTVSYIFVPL